MATGESITRVLSHLSSARLAPYVRECGNDPRRALELYQWNLRLSAEFQQVLALTEVVLRNAIDRELRRWNARQSTDEARGSLAYSADWTTNPARPLNSMTSGARRTAGKHAEEALAVRGGASVRPGEGITHDDVVAQLTFGTWVKLLPTKDRADKHFRARQVLWEEAVQYAFPHRDIARDPLGYVLADRASRLHALRNRVSHMEPLLQVEVGQRHRDALRLLGAISPESRDWCAGISRVIPVDRARPQAVALRRTVS